MREVPIIEILWHGRGGQGAFTAARLLGAACSFADGRYALAFPSFGPERRGAPMRAFTKLDRKPVGDRSAVSQADFVIYLDNTLFGEGWEAELKEGGKVLVNTQETFDDPREAQAGNPAILSSLRRPPMPRTSSFAFPWLRHARSEPGSSGKARKTFAAQNSGPAGFSLDSLPSART